MSYLKIRNSVRVYFSNGQNVNVSCIASASVTCQCVGLRCPHELMRVG